MLLRKIVKASRKVALIRIHTMEKSLNRHLKCRKFSHAYPWTSLVCVLEEEER